MITIIIINGNPQYSKSTGQEIGTLPERIYRVRWRLGPGRRTELWTQSYSYSLWRSGQEVWLLVADNWSWKRSGRSALPSHQPSSLGADTQARIGFPGSPGGMASPLLGTRAFPLVEPVLHRTACQSGVSIHTSSPTTTTGACVSPNTFSGCNGI